jgi:hypothetical protein
MELKNIHSYTHTHTCANIHTLISIFNNLQALFKHDDVEFFFNEWKIWNYEKFIKKSISGKATINVDEK